MALATDLERVGRLELHSAQLGRLATHLMLTRFVWWEYLGSNQRPLDYRSSVLPLNYTPLNLVRPEGLEPTKAITAGRFTVSTLCHSGHERIVFFIFLLS